MQFIDLLNRCSTKSVYAKTPKGAWSHRKSNIGYLRVFSGITYAYVLDALEKKNMMIKVKSIFLFVITKGYKLYNPQTKKVIVNRDAIFYEQVV